MPVKDANRRPREVGPPPRPILVRPGFLAADRCADLMEAFRRAATAPPDRQWHRPPLRVMPHRRELNGRLLGRLRNPEAANTLGATRRRAVEEIRSFYNVQPPLDVEFTLITEMGPGDAHPLHADNERVEDDDTWVPNHTPFRDYVGIIYLNTGGVDYDGGILRFPVLGREIAPATGEFVGFACGREHQHEVTPLERGMRYSVAMWMTRDPDCFEPWD